MRQVECLALVAQMIENLFNDGLLLDVRYHCEPTAATPADLYVDMKRPLELLCPGYRA